MEEDPVLEDLAVAPVAPVEAEEAEEGEHVDADAGEAKDSDLSSISSGMSEDGPVSAPKESELNGRTDGKETEDATDKISSDEDGGLSDSNVVNTNGLTATDVSKETEDATDKISSDEDGGLSDSNVVNTNGLAAADGSKENESPQKKSVAPRGSPPRRRRPAPSPSLSLSRSPSKSPRQKRRGSRSDSRPKVSRPQKPRSRSRSRSGDRRVIPRRRPRISRSRSRSRSPANHPTRRKHHDLPRYDVRHVISEKREKARKDVPLKDPGSDKGKSASKGARVVARGRRKNRSSSDRSLSRSRSRSLRRNARRSRSRSVRRSRSKSFRRSRSRSAPRRSRASRSRSPRSRSRSRRRSRSRSSKSPRSPQRKKKASKKRNSSKSEKVSQKKAKRKTTTKSTKTKKLTKSTSVPVVTIPDHSTSLTKRARGVGLPHAEKAVYESGDKILVSVTFNNPPKKKKSKKAPEPKEQHNTSLADLSNQKPAAVIDIMSSPYQIIEASPKEMIDLLSDDEDAPKPAPADSTTGGPSQHRGPCTPPLHESIQVSMGPMTPSDSANPYDPCSPTESPKDASWSQPDESNEWESPHCSTDQIPFVAEDTPAVTTTAEARKNGGAHEDDDDLDDDNMDLVHDMDMGSPSSPQGSDFSDIFEPPSSTPSVSKSKHGKQQKSGKSAKKDLFSTGKTQLKVTDDKLRIVDEVPTSAVELKVKDKYLKKVQRQERIVDEIKSVLKPFYNKKRISKLSYKEIMRKCVPKVCHSKNGEINTSKIQKLVTGYVRKYHYAEKKAVNERK